RRRRRGRPRERRDGARERSALPLAGAQAPPGRSRQDQGSGKRSWDAAGSASSAGVLRVGDRTGRPGGGGTYPGWRRARTPAAATSGSQATNRGPYEWIAAVTATRATAMVNSAAAAASFRPCVTFPMIGADVDAGWIR